MLDQLIEIFCDFDDFCKQFNDFCKFNSLEAQTHRKRRGPEASLHDSEVMTILLMFHQSGFKYLKNFYNGPMGDIMRTYFPKMPSYERFVFLQNRVFLPMMLFFHSRMGKKTGIYYVDSTPLPVCHNRRIHKHKTFAGLADRGKSSMGWFFGLKLHLIFNDLNEIVAIKITPGNISDAAAVPSLSKNLIGKLFGDKGYIGKNLAEILLRRGLALFTRVRKNMKSLPISLADKILLNKRNMAETIIGSIKGFSSLNIPKHRLPLNAFLHIITALTAYQINPIKINGYFNKMALAS